MAGTLTVQAYLNQGEISVTEFPGPTLQVTVVPRQFRLVFDPSMITIVAGNSAEVTLTLESIVGELAEGEVVTVELPVDTTQVVWTEQSPITFTREEMSTRVAVNTTRRGGNPVQVQFAPQPVPVLGVMVDSQPLSVSVLIRRFLVDINVGPNENLRVEQGIAASYFIRFEARTATQLFEDEAVTVRLIAIGSDDRTSEDIRINPIPAFATLDDPSKASLALDTVTEFLIQASPSASTGTYRIEIEVEISDVDGGTVSGRLSGRVDAIRSSLYGVAILGQDNLAFEVVPGVRREFNLVFNEQTDANVPGSIIDSLTVLSSERVEVWLLLEGVDGAFLSDDESVTVNLSLLSDNNQFTVTDGSNALDTVVLTSTDNGLITLDATANVGLAEAFSATVTAMIDSGQAGLPVADFNDASLSVSVVPLREFNLVFSVQTDTNEPGDDVLVEQSVFIGGTTPVWLSLEGVGGATLSGDESVEVSLSSDNAQFTVTDGSNALDTVVLSASIDRMLITLDATANVGEVAVMLTAAVDSDQARLPAANFMDATLQVNVVAREFQLVFDPSMISIVAGNSAEVTLTLESINGELAEGEVVTVELPTDTTQEVWTDQSPITFTSEEMSTRVTVHATRRGRNPVQVQFAPQPVPVLSVMIDSQPLSVSVINRTFIVELASLNRVEQGIATSYFIGLRALTATQLFEDEAVTVRLIAIGADNMISEDIRINPIPAFATLDDPSKASLAVDTVTEFLIQASPSASTGTYQLDIEVEISDVDGGTVSGRPSEGFAIIASSLYLVSLTGANLPLSFEVVPGPRRAFNLVFNEQTDANVPGSIIDSLTVVAGERVEVWLSLEGMNGAFLSDDESVTVNLSLLSDNNQFTATDGSDAFDTVVLSASIQSVLITLDATANAGLAEAFSAEVTAMIDSDQEGLPAADFNDASLPVSVEPLREFRLVFSEQTDTNEPGDQIDRVEVVAGNVAEVWLSLEGVGDATLGDDESVGVTVSFSSENNQFTITDNDGGVLDTAALSAPTPRVLIRLDATANAGLAEAFSVTVTAMVDSNQEELSPRAELIDAELAVNVVQPYFRLVFREADITDINAPSGNIIDRVEIPAGGRGFPVPVWLSLEGVNGSTLADDESVEVTVSFSSLNDQFSAIFNTGASTAVLSTLNPRGLVVLDLPVSAGTVEVEVFSATVFAMVDPNQAGLPAANFIGATLPVRAVREVGLVFDIGPIVEVARGGSTPLSVTTEPLLAAGEVVTVRLTVDSATGLSFDGANTYEIEIRLDNDQPSQMLDLFATATATDATVPLGVEVADRENVIVNLPAEPLSIEVFERQFRLMFQFFSQQNLPAYLTINSGILIEGLDDRSVLFEDEEVYAVFEYRGVVRGRVLQVVEDSFRFFTFNAGSMLGVSDLTASATLPGADIAGATQEIDVIPFLTTLRFEPANFTVRGGESFDVRLSLNIPGPRQLPEGVVLVVTLPSDNTRPVWTDNASIELAGTVLTRTIRVHTSAQVGTVRDIEFPAEVTPFAGVTVDSNPLIIDIVQFELAFASTDVEAIEALTVASGGSVQVPLSLEGPDDLRLMANEEVTVRVSLGGVELILLPEIIFTADNLVTTFTLEIPDSAPGTLLDLTARAGLSGVEIASTTVPVTISGSLRSMMLMFDEPSIVLPIGTETTALLMLEDASMLANDESVTVLVSLTPEVKGVTISGPQEIMLSKSKSTAVITLKASMDAGIGVSKMIAVSGDSNSKTLQNLRSEEIPVEVINNRQEPVRRIRLRLKVFLEGLLQ